MVKIDKEVVDSGPDAIKDTSQGDSPNEGETD